ncbi:hypothetical protein AMECASPLE_030356 [Ameca splendens]|uniref:Uncharacterized protein n=1 Tax=Ameca splendens TaxID=208324 RepID=A0ABV0Z3V7_9TELE
MEIISQRVDRENQFRIQISGENLLERGILQWQQQKKSSPTAALHVSFFGEAGVDTGALRKFLTGKIEEYIRNRSAKIFSIYAILAITYSLSRTSSSILI